MINAEKIQIAKIKYFQLVKKFMLFRIQKSMIVVKKYHNYQRLDSKMYNRSNRVLLVISKFNNKNLPLKQSKDEKNKEKSRRN